MKYRSKPIDNPDKISMLLPTRGRPDKLRVALNSYNRTIHRHDLFDVWVYVDQDDLITREYIESGEWREFGFVINWIVEKNTLAMGAMTNMLWQRCPTNPGIYMPSADDYIIKTSDWDDIIRAAFSTISDRIGLASIQERDDQETVVWPVMSAEWLNAVGYMMTDYFPFWYDDLWLGEIAMLVNRLIKLPIEVETMGGKGRTPRMKNLPFWNAFYINLIDERIEAANNLLSVIYKTDIAHIDENHELIKLFKNGEQYQHTLDELISIENALKDESYFNDIERSFRYLKIELNAVEILCRKYHHYVPVNIDKAISILKNITASSLISQVIDDLVTAISERRYDRK